MRSSACSAPAPIPSARSRSSRAAEPRRDARRRRRISSTTTSGACWPGSGSPRVDAAEEVVYGDQTTGAESDIRQATQLARQMVGRFGMSEEIGFVAVLAAGQGSVGAAGPERGLGARGSAPCDSSRLEIVVGARRGDPAPDQLRGVSTRSRRRSCGRRRSTSREAYAAAGLTAPVAAQDTAPAEPALTGSA